MRAPQSDSRAHAGSAFAIIDPLALSDAAVGSAPKFDAAAPWLYGEAELECWRLMVLRQQTRAAQLKVGYPGSFHTPFGKVFFRCCLPELLAAQVIQLYAVGELVLRVAGQQCYSGPASAEVHKVELPGTIGVGAVTVEIELNSTTGEPPALRIEHGSLATGQARWLWSADRSVWSDPVPYAPSNCGRPPHCQQDRQVLVLPVGRDGDTYDFGREVFGRIVVKCAVEPVLRVGESKAEAANDDPAHFEQATAMVAAGPGRWSSEHLLALRYARVAGAEVSELGCDMVVHPVSYRGAFACSDQQLTRVWMHSTYTLRLCMHDFLLDGIKRDRLPWMGDLAVGLLANAYSFGDREIIRRSLSVLARAGVAPTDINGIVDYSLWWLIAEDLYQQFYGDHQHCARIWPRVKTAVDALVQRCDVAGLLVPGSDTWLFIDWGDCEKQTAVQILWWWALHSAAALAERMADTSAATAWRQRADQLAAALHSTGHDAQSELWRGSLTAAGSLSRHATILAVVSGLATLSPARQALLAEALRQPTLAPVTTPYMKGIECLAIARLGAAAGCLAQIDAYWGGMLKAGATTFWEAYNPSATAAAALAFYGRPFGKSLCHAWSTWPTHLLPAVVLGIQPSSDGWRSFTVKPCLGDLDWACACIPTDFGNIEVEATANQVSILVPKGCCCQAADASLVGPGWFSVPVGGGLAVPHPRRGVT